MTFSSQSSNSKTERKYPEWVSQGLEDGANYARDQNTRFMSENPLYMVAGFTPDQMNAMEGLRATAMDYGGNAGVPDAQAIIEGSQIGPNDYKQFMNPYLKDVGKTTLDNMRREYQNMQAGIGARHANTVAFGGSGPALERAQVSRGMNEAVPAAIGQIMSQGFDKAQSLAAKNAELRSRAYQTASNLQDADLNRRLSSTAAVMGAGDKQQGLAQTALDIPYTSLKRFLETIPQALDFTETQQSSSSGGSFNIGKILGGIGGLLGGSDERLKTDIKKVGRDTATGLDFYAYRYKGDPKSYPKTVGPMAQDVEKKYPEMVTEVAGRKVIASPFMEVMQGKVTRKGGKG